MEIKELIEKIRNRDIVPYMTFTIFFDNKKEINWEKIEDFVKLRGEPFEIDEDEATLDLSDCDDFFRYFEKGEFKTIEAIDKRFCEKIADFLTELVKIVAIKKIKMTCEFSVSNREGSQ
ncbi:MAG: hypothetical protein HXS54_01130 [Theionarchaea archaeon]|nr:hypothetical protein [Theionarchaea archaeon]